MKCFLTGIKCNKNKFLSLVQCTHDTLINQNKTNFNLKSSIRKWLFHKSNLKTFTDFMKAWCCYSFFFTTVSLRSLSNNFRLRFKSYRIFMKGSTTKVMPYSEILVEHSASFNHGRRKGGAGVVFPPGFWNLIFSYYFCSKKGCYRSFEWIKGNFTTAGPPCKNPFGYPGKIL